MSLLTNLRKRGLRDILSLKKIRVFFRFLTKGKKEKYEELKVREYLEQIVFRMRKCPDCVEAGECLHCGCKSPELFYDKDNYCSEDRWQEMKNPEEWRKHKKKHGIIIKPKYINDIKIHGIIKYD